MLKSVSIDIKCIKRKGVILTNRNYKMDRIRVTANMLSPIVTGGGYMTLDGLLGALLFDELQDVEAAHGAIPIKCKDGLFSASAAIMEASRDRITFIASLRPGHSIDPDLILKNKKGLLHRKFDTSLTNVMNTYTELSANSVTWFAEGDADQIIKLVESVQFIGKRRASGFGRVAGWSIDTDNLDGIEGYFGGPLRPVPAEMFAGDRSHPVIDAAWRPAYWNPNHRAACFAPE